MRLFAQRSGRLLGTRSGSTTPPDGGRRRSVGLQAPVKDKRARGGRDRDGVIDRRGSRPIIVENDVDEALILIQGVNGCHFGLFGRLVYSGQAI